jgi:hypothetical protein
MYSDNVLMLISAPRVGSQFSINVAPGTNTGISRPCASKSGSPAASVAKSASKTYPVADCELPPVRLLWYHSVPPLTS